MVLNPEARPLVPPTGGGEPDEYLKNILKNEKTKEIVITDKAGNQTKFPYGSDISKYLQDIRQNTEFQTITIVKSTGEEISFPYGSGVWVGTTEPPEGYLIWINPEGDEATYLKKIVKDEKKVIITDSLDNETEIPIGGSGKQNSYASITPIHEYAHQAVYTDIDYKGAYEFFKQMKPNTYSKYSYKPKKPLDSPIGGCSAFYALGIMGRLYDWGFNEQESIEVITPAMNGRKAVVGTGYNREITKALVESGAYNKSFDYIPFELVDGYNEDGFAIAMLVVPNDINTTTGTTPSGKVEAEVSTIMLPRYLLDRCSTIEEAMNTLQTKVSVYNVMPLIMMGYEVHFFVADATGNHGVIEFINNEPIFHYANAATNFYIHGVNFNEDGTVYTPATQDAEHDAKNTNLITDYGSGLERYNLIINTLREAKGPEVIEQLLYDLKFTKAYDRKTTPFRYTEFVGGDYKVNTPAATYDADGGIVDRAIAEFERRDRATGTTWQTVHGGLIDLEAKKSYLVFQEDITNVYEFGLDYYTARQVDGLIGSLKYGNLKYNEAQDLVDSEFNQVMENLKLGARIDSHGTMETLYDAQGIDIVFDGKSFIIPNASVRAFNSEKVYEVPLTFGGLGTVIVDGKYKSDTYLVLKADLQGVYFQSLEVVGTDIVISVKTDLTEIPHLTGASINELTIEKEYTPIAQQFIPHDSTKEDVELEPKLFYILANNWNTYSKHIAKVGEGAYAISLVLYCSTALSANEQISILNSLQVNNKYLIQPVALVVSTYNGRAASAYCSTGGGLWFRPLEAIPAGGSKTTDEKIYISGIVFIDTTKQERKED